MKSRTCCCNGALLRRILTRAALLWGGYLILWLVALPVELLSKPEWYTAIERRELVLSASAVYSHAIPFFYGLLVAWLLFLYLYRSRSANFFGALPLRRETVFLTHYLAGLLCALVPNFLIMGATMLAGASCGVSLVTESAIWFAAHSLGYVFYYSLAVLCAMVVGNLIAMPCLYVIVNFVVVVVETVVKELLEGLLYGFRFSGSAKLGFLSPFYYTVLDGNGPACVRTWDGGTITALEFTGWKFLLIYAAVGVALAVGAFFLYRHRRMEVAGDVVAIKQLKPVFRYVFAFGFALVAGTALAEMVVDSMASQYARSICACVVLCAAVGYFLGEMILLRTLRVFRKKNFLRCSICVVLTAVTLLCVRLDLLGVESYVPDAEEVIGVSLQDSRHDVTDPTGIRQVLELHREILAHKAETEQKCREDVWTPRFKLTYTLADGREVSRSYRLPVVKNQPADPESLIYQFEEIYNTPEFILARELPDEDVTLENIHNCVIYYYDTEKQYTVTLDPSNAETCALWQQAMLPDMKAGRLGVEYYTDRSRTEQTVVQPAGSAETATMAVSSTYSEVSVELELYTDRASGKTGYYYYTIPAEATLTRQALNGLGVPDSAFEIPNEE